MFVDPDLQSLQVSNIPVHENFSLDAFVFPRIR